MLLCFIYLKALKPNTIYVCSAGQKPVWNNRHVPCDFSTSWKKRNNSWCRKALWEIGSAHTDFASSPRLRHQNNNRGIASASLSPSTTTAREIHSLIRARALHPRCGVRVHPPPSRARHPRWCGPPCLQIDALEWRTEADPNFGRALLRAQWQVGDRWISDASPLTPPLIVRGAARSEESCQLGRRAQPPLCWAAACRSGIHEQGSVRCAPRLPPADPRPRRRCTGDHRDLGQESRRWTQTLQQGPVRLSADAGPPRRQRFRPTWRRAGQFYFLYAFEFLLRAWAPVGGVFVHLGLSCCFLLCVARPA